MFSVSLKPVRLVRKGVVQMPEYTVRRGDNLSKIARGYGMTWRELYEFDGGTGVTNRERLNEQKRRENRPRSSVDNPDLIYPGNIVLVPSEITSITVRRRIESGSSGRIQVQRRGGRTQITRVVVPLDRRAGESRGREESRTRRRTQNFYAWDNLFALHRFDSAEGYRSNLVRVVNEFVQDRSPSARNRGVDIWIIQDNNIYIYRDGGNSLGSLSLRCPVRGLAGAYAWYRFPNSDLRVILDMSMNRGTFQAECAYENAQEVGNYMLGSVRDMIAESDRSNYDNLIQRGKKIVYYIAPKDETEWGQLIYSGGAGRLEGYLNDEELRERINRRNLNFLQGYGEIYRARLNQYIEDLQRTESFQAIRDLGAPPEPLYFPPPNSANQEERQGIFEAHDLSSFRAWREISDHIAGLRNIHPPGSIFLRTKFKVEAQVRAGMGTQRGEVGVFDKVSIETNLDIDANGNIITGTKISNEVGIGGELRARRGNMKIQFASVSDSTGSQKEVAKIELSRGPIKYGFEVSSDGAVKITYRSLQAEVNPNEGQISYGGEFQIPDDGSVYIGICFQGITDDYILAYLTRAPGFFESIEPEELICAEWGDLTLQEQEKLRVLDWNRDLWSRRFDLTLNERPDATRISWDQLTSEQRIAAVNLRFRRAIWNWNRHLSTSCPQRGGNGEEEDEWGPWE